MIRFSLFGKINVALNKAIPKKRTLSSTKFIGLVPLQQQRHLFKHNKITAELMLSKRPPDSPRKLGIRDTLGTFNTARPRAMFK